ncbi:MAG TPA: hypothetical protein PK089_05275 [Methanoregulaceae archaeon]|nr:hypothetical protein [Methanoregulaceae archaeon]HQJ88550.1 hypothetical protein [Methanoregulaceae archaeon]
MFAIRFYRVYDTGDEIDLEELESVLTADGSAVLTPFTRTMPTSIWIRDPPLEVRLPPVNVALQNGAYHLDAIARIHQIGAVSISFILHDELADPSSLLPVALAFAGQQGLDTPFLDALAVVIDLLGPAIGTRPIEPEFYEDHTIYIVDRLDPAFDTVALLAGEQIRFSQTTRDEMLKNSLSYSVDDLVILAWDSALLVDPEPPMDLVDVIEYALVLVFELRFYDRVLDRQVQRMYDDIEAADRFSRFRRRREYRRILNRIMETHAEISEVTEVVENQLRVTGDVFYARVYATALRVLRADLWRASVDRRLQVVRDNYRMLSDELNREHANVLEWIIIILIALEFAYALWGTTRG